MTSPAFRRLALDLREDDLLPLPQLPEGKGRDCSLAAFLRELFTQPDGNLEARTGAVLLDEAGQPRGIIAPFGAEWPRAEVQALELFATARKVSWYRLVLFRVDPSPRCQPAGVALQFALDMRALGILFAVEVEDLLILKAQRCWAFSRLPVLAASLNCEATLDRSLRYLMASGFERSLPPIKPDEATGNRHPPTGALIQGPWNGCPVEAR